MPWLSSEESALPQEDIVSFAFDHCDFDPDKPLCHDLDNPEISLSWNQGRSMVRKLVAGFRKWGMQKGDCFSLTSFNHIMYSLCFLGGIGAGGIFSGMNPAYQVHEIRHHIVTAKVKYLIVEPELLDNLLEAAREEDIPAENILIFNTRGRSVPPGFRSWQWLLEQGEEDWDRITDLETLKTTQIARLTTSGTTGLPKFAKQTHFNATSFHHMATEAKQAPWESRRVFVFPSFHVAAVPSMHISPFRSGEKGWLMRRFDLETLLAGIEKHQVTDLGVSPPLVIAIITSPLRHKYSLRSVKSISCGAAPLDGESQRRLRALCAPDSTVTQVWGMTETTSALCLFRYPESDDTGSVGNRFLPNTDVKLVDDNGKDITDFDVVGELCVRGPTVVKGYYNNAAANAESYDDDGYLRTGDIAYCEKTTKKWYIVDRKKELIKVRGFQVAPPELEGVLRSHADVDDCAVIGARSHPKDIEEKPRAYVVLRPGATTSKDTLRELISRKLASYKALTGGVVFTEEIPKSPSGKVLKRVLREQAQSETPSRAKI